MRREPSTTEPLNRTVLLVEANLPKREQLYDLLTRHGCTVMAVQSGELTITALKHGRPDLILADTALPDMTGWELAEQIRAFDTQVALILFGRAQTPPAPVPAALKLGPCLPYDMDEQALVDAISRTARSNAPVRPERWPGRILVVDDEPKLRGVLERFLELHGFTVDCASSGEEALAHLNEHGMPSAVLLDIQMPGMDGILTLKKLKALKPTLPVLMLTAMDDSQVVEEARALGAMDYILKPFNLEYLETVLLSKLLSGTSS